MAILWKQIKTVPFAKWSTIASENQHNKQSLLSGSQIYIHIYKMLENNIFLCSKKKCYFHPLLPKSSFSLPMSTDWVWVRARFLQITSNSPLHYNNLQGNICANYWLKNAARCWQNTKKYFSTKIFLLLFFPSFWKYPRFHWNFFRKLSDKFCDKFIIFRT